MHMQIESIWVTVYIRETCHVDISGDEHCRRSAFGQISNFTHLPYDVMRIGFHPIMYKMFDDMVALVVVSDNKMKRGSRISRSIIPIQVHSIIPMQD